MVDLVEEARRSRRIRRSFWGPSFDSMMMDEDEEDDEEWFGIDDNTNLQLTAQGAEELKREEMFQNREEFLENIRGRSANTPDFSVLDRDANKFIVFVYGTLKKGFSNHGLLAHSQYLGLARTVHERFTMYPGSFPVVFDETEGFSHITKGCILGEAYAVDVYTLAALDRLEANGMMYNRKKVPISMTQQIDEASGRPNVKVAFTYFGSRSYWKHVNDKMLMIPVNNGARSTLSWFKGATA